MIQNKILIEASLEDIASIIRKEVTDAVNQIKTSITPDEFLTKREVAELLQVSTKTIEVWTDSGWLRSYRIETKFDSKERRLKMHLNKQPLNKMLETVIEEAFGSEGFSQIDAPNDIMFHLKEMEKEIYISQTIYNKDQNFLRILDWHLKKISIIENLITSDPRFEWKEIQNEMVRLFKVDPELTGYDIQFDFKESDPTNRALIKVDLFNKNK